MRLSETLNKARSQEHALKASLSSVDVSLVRRLLVVRLPIPTTQPQHSGRGEGAWRGRGRSRQERKVSMFTLRQQAGEGIPLAVFVLLSPHDSEWEHGQGNTKPQGGVFPGRLHNSRTNLCPSPPAGYRVLLQVCPRRSLLSTWYRHLRPCIERARQGRRRPKKKGKLECRRVKLVVLPRRRRLVSLNSLTMAAANSAPEWMTTRFCTKAATAKTASATR